MACDICCETADNSFVVAVMAAATFASSEWDWCSIGGEGWAEGCSDCSIGEDDDAATTTDGADDDDTEVGLDLG